MTPVPFDARTSDTDSVAPEFESVSLVNRLPVVSGVRAPVVKLSLTATGWAGVMVIVTVAALDVLPRLSLAVYVNVSAPGEVAVTEPNAPLGL